MKNLMIDVGNSCIKLFFTDNNLKLIEKKIIKNKEKEKLFQILKQENNINLVSISSVVPNLELEIIDYLKENKINYYNLQSSDYFNLWQYQDIDLSALGADRFVDIMAAKKYNDQIIVIDIGTAMTVDVVDNNHYISGYIYPGIYTVKETIIKNAAKLEDFNYQKVSENNLNITTIAQLNDGILYGIIGVINMHLKILSETIKINDFNIFLTGGTITELQKYIPKETIERLIEYPIEIKENLNYEGIKQITKKIIGQNNEKREY